MLNCFRKALTCTEGLDDSDLKPFWHLLVLTDACRFGVVSRPEGKGAATRGFTFTFMVNQSRRHCRVPNGAALKLGRIIVLETIGFKAG